MPEDGLPLAAVHANVRGEVPPEPVALQETVAPTVPVKGQLIVTARVDRLNVAFVE